VANATCERGIEAPRRVAAEMTGPPWWVLPVVVALGIVLRCWDLGRNGLTFDESFTAAAGRRSVESLFTYLRHNDSHPPLDYLLRAPLARAGADAVAFRLPSVAFAVGALVLFAWWMRRRGWVGVLATALFAVSSFELRYGRTARMYALMELLGVIAVVVATAWLARPRPWHAWVAGGVIAVGLFDHVSALLLGLGLLAVAGLRRDREAWRWRVALGLGVVPWAVLWGPSFLVQVRDDHAGWIPPTSVHSFAQSVGTPITELGAAWSLVVLVVAFGGFLLWKRAGDLGRVWLCCYALPLVALAVAGLVAEVFIPRTMIFAAWAPPLAVAALAAEAGRRWVPLGVAVGVLAVALAVPSTLALLQERIEPDVVMQHANAVVADGDVVVVRPAWYLPLVEWRVGVRSGLPWHDVTIPGVRDIGAVQLGRGPASGRVWVVTPVNVTAPFAGAPACALPWSSGSTDIVCRSVVVSTRTAS
jgi:hypothetical protein